MNRKYRRIVVYGDQDKYKRLQDIIGFYAVSKWFRKQLDSFLIKRESAKNESN